MPHWVERGPSHDERVGGDRAEAYPYLCLSGHPRWRVHSQHDDMQWLREIQTNKIVGADGYAYQTAWIHPDDAATKACRPATWSRSQRAGRGAGGSLRHRARDARSCLGRPRRPVRPYRSGEFDRGGAINCITPRKTTSKNATGMVSGAFLLDFEKADLTELAHRRPAVWARPIDKTGLAWKRSHLPSPHSLPYPPPFSPFSSRLRSPDSSECLHSAPNKVERLEYPEQYRSHARHQKAAEVQVLRRDD